MNSVTRHKNLRKIFLINILLATELLIDQEEVLLHMSKCHGISLIATFRIIGMWKSGKATQQFQFSIRNYEL